MELSSITPLVLTWNEEENISRTLDRLDWADRVVIVDSGSTDRTLEIASKFSNVEVVTRTFDDHSSQWNFGISQVNTAWVLALDADFVIAHDLPEELRSIPADTETVGFQSAFRYCVNGTPLKGSLYPPRTVLFRKDACEYVQDGHTQLLTGDSPNAMLVAKIDHDDRKPLKRWLASQAKYASLEAQKLQTDTDSPLRLPDKIRKMIWPAAPITFVYTLLVKRTLFDGWNGIFYALQRTYAELLLSLELLSSKLERR